MKLIERLKKWIAGFTAASLVLAMLPIAVMPLSVSAAVPGNYPGTVVADGSNGGSAAWVNPGNAATSNDLYATATSLSGGARPEITQYLKASNFSLAVPTGAKINGIEVRLERKTDSTSVKDVTLQLLNKGVLVGGNKAGQGSTGYASCISPVTGTNCWTTSESTVTYGGPTDLWGTTWTEADLNNALTGLVFSAQRTYGTGDKVISVDSISMTVYYAENTAPSVPVLVTPANNEVTNDNTPTFSWAPSVDNEDDAVSYVLSIAGPITESMLVGGGTSYNHAIMPDGNYTWQVRALDEHGISSPWAAPQAFTIDTVNPLISGVTVSPDPFSPKDLNGIKDVANVNYTLSEDGKVTVKIYDNSFEPVLIRTLAVDKAVKAGANVEAWDGKDDAANYVADGTYLVTISGQDLAGNKAVLEDSAPLNVTVDNTAPVVADMKDVRTNVAVNLEGSATDGESSFAGTYEWKQVAGPVGGTVTFGNANDPATKVSADVDGKYTLELTATDLAGNTATKQITFELDTKVNPVTDTLAVVAGDGRVTLKWTNPTDADFSGVEILRSKVEGEEGTSLTKLGKDAVEYVDTDVIAGVTYYYTIRALDDLGNKADAAVIEVTPELAKVVSAAPVAPTNTTYGNGHSSSSQNQVTAPTQEVKGGNTDENKGDESNDDGSRTLSAFGIGLLAVLALVGLYLLYLQNPDWFSWLFFWKRRKNKMNGKK